MVQKTLHALAIGLAAALVAGCGAGSNAGALPPSAYNAFSSRDGDPPATIQQNGFGITVQQTFLWPPNHNMVNVGFSSTELVSVSVYADEPNEDQTGDGKFSHDACDCVEVRSERKGDGDGRVYLIIARSVADPTEFACATVVVPQSLNASDITSVQAQAAAAMAYCEANNGTAPADFFDVKHGEVIGPKQ